MLKWFSETPMYPYLGEDKLIGAATEDGIISVKSAYNLIVQKKFAVWEF